MRPRTAIRGGVLAVLLLVLILLVAYSAVSAWGQRRWAESSSRFERETGTLDLESLELPEVLEERNAAAWISKGAGALVLNKEPRRSSTVLNPTTNRPADWTGEEIAALRGAIALNQHGLAVLAHARGLEEFTFGIRMRDGSTAKLPNLLQIVDATKLIFARGSLALRDGDRASAISDSALIGSMARALQRESPLIVVLVGINIERFQLRLVQALIADPALTPDELRDVVAGILRSDPRGDYSRALAADAAVTCSELRPLGRVNGPPRQGTVQPGLRLARAMAGDVLAASCLDVYRETAAAFNAPVLSIPGRIEEVQRRLHSTWGSRRTLKQVSNLVSGSERAWLNLEMRRLSHAAAILRERAWRDGAYPADLAGFPPHAAPDPDGAGAWTYERLPDGRAHLAAPAAAALAVKILYKEQAAVAPFAWTLPPPIMRSTG